MLRAKNNKKSDQDIMEQQTKKPIPGSTVTRKMTDLDEQTGNIYKSVAIIAKRANQISSQTKQELNRKLAEFTTTTDTLEETFENREQIEISRHYERLPKPSIVATEEFLEDRIYYREPEPAGNDEKEIV